MFRDGTSSLTANRRLISSALSSFCKTILKHEKDSSQIPSFLKCTLRCVFKIKGFLEILLASAN